MKEYTKKLIQDSLKNLGLPEALFVVEHTSNLQFGDYSTNVAMVLAKESNKNPKDLAETICNQLVKIGSSKFEKVEVAGPGFINFTISADTLMQVVKGILDQKERFGTNENLFKKKIIVEYTDPNPFKEFHLGHLMSNTIGEALARLIEASGAEVKRACYQGDVGMHVAKAVAFKYINNSKWETVQNVAVSYAMGALKYESDNTFKEKVVEINKKIYQKTDPEINEIYLLGKKLTLDYFETIYKRLGTKFDYYFFESKTAEFGKALVHEHPEIFTESEGAIVFEGEKRDPKLHTRVFINKEGLPTYEAKELGLAKIKYDSYEYDQSIVITGNEINDYFRVLLSAMSEVFPDLAQKTKHISHGMLRLPTGKMSSRTGDVITAESVLAVAEEKAKEVAKDKRADDQKILSEQVALAAIKSSILRQAPGRDVIFDFDTSITFEGDSGPYLQYTRARINSIAEKANSLKISPSPSIGEKVFDVERVLSRYPDVVERAGEEMAPHYIVTYLTELAGSFNSFYAAEQIVKIEDESSARKLAIALGVGQVLKNGLTLLGIPVPEKM